MTISLSYKIENSIHHVEPRVQWERWEVDVQQLPSSPTNTFHEQVNLRVQAE